MKKNDQYEQPYIDDGIIPKDEIYCFLRVGESRHTHEAKLMEVNSIQVAIYLSSSFNPFKVGDITKATIDLRCKVFERPLWMDLKVKKLSTNNQVTIDIIRVDETHKVIFNKFFKKERRV